ncbi:hypothetical protein KY290_005764 [Solanum tuberosum]|uniref:PRC-barrel domain-containing protein n=1 Tax=Solanum tuberosum TaxID=4113 RepID=A0ABQ7WF34_SOLTU|nr:hypothetical protein KY284_005813 [Solanum tuberosum]KAH0723078.1 hypothetical protein KY289_006122 [Solanum tuberosum]KAH0779337.1 hypothetical protein KY290_005764 [Solanum tuberosum]
MCNCLSPTTFFPHSSSFSFGFTTSKLTHKSPPFFGSTPYSHRNLELGKSKRGIPKSSSSDGYDFFDDLWFKNEEETEIPVIEASKIEKQADIPSPRKGINDEDDDRGVGFLELGREAEEIMKRDVGEKIELEKGIVRRKKQMMKRSNLIAKQVISIQSALSLGFVSQLWVDINSWIVFLVEVRPNLLSGEGEKFLLEDVKQVGDVVLVGDESVMENEFKLVGLQTLVGYNVVTPRQRNVGKVRGYTFNINSGAVESLELDSLGISIIPSTLVSTYGLFVEDVVDVLSDTIVVHEAAASRLQRLTKGLWDAQKMAYSADEMQDYSNLRNTRAKPEYSRSRKKSSGKKLRKKLKELADDWDLPMDFF